MLFAQIAVAAYSCPLPADSVRAAPASPCEQVDSELGNLCHKHCHDAQQSQDGVAPLVAFVPSFVAQLPLAAVSQPAAYRVDFAPLLHAPPPPLTVRNCCFRI
jgi:hypothetical protein